MTPLFSIIVPTYNRTELLLTRCLPSILEQTEQDFEVLVIGDGTEKATVDAMAAFDDPRVTFHQRRHTVYPKDEGTKWLVLGLRCLNYGLDQAKGEWIATLADDDAWSPDHLEKLLAAAKAAGTDAAYGKSKATWHDGRISYYGHWPPGGAVFCDGAIIWKASLNYRYDWACIKRGLAEDADLWERMVAGGVTFTFIHDIIHYYYPNPR